MAVGMAWYRRETYSVCLDLFSDADQLPSTYDDWLVIAKQTEQDLKRRGINVVRAVIEPEAFRWWCADHGHAKIDTKARTDFANEVAAKHLTGHTSDS